MDITIQKLINSVSLMGYDELLGQGRNLVSNIMDMMLEKYSKNEKFTFDLISHFAIYAVSIDNKISEKEIIYINDITGLSLTKNEIKKTFNEKVSKGIDIFNILGCFKQDILESFIYLAAYIFIIDGKIDEQERKVLRRLFDAYHDKDKVIRNVVTDKKIEDDILIKQNEFLTIKDSLNNSYKEYSKIKEEYITHVVRNYNIKSQYETLIASLNDLRNNEYTELKNKTHDDAIEIEKLEIKLKQSSVFSFNKKKKYNVELEELKELYRLESIEFEKVKKEIEEEQSFLKDLELDIKKEEEFINSKKEYHDSLLKKIKDLELSLIKSYQEGLALYTYSDIKVGDTILFGHNDNKLIPWDVLEVSDNTILLISHYVLDMGRYNETSDNLLNGSNYANSLLRSYMNGPLMNRIFTKDEKKSIVLSKVDNSISSQTFVNVKGEVKPDIELLSEDTYDYLFPISSSEVYKYYPKKFDSLAIPDSYALKQGLHQNRKTGFSVYWTRSPYSKDSSYLVVSDNKQKDEVTDYRLDYEVVFKDSLGIRPLMRLRIDSKEEMLAKALEIQKRKMNM